MESYLFESTDKTKNIINIHCTVFPDMKVTRSMYVNSHHVESFEVGEYVYLESHQTHIYVNYETFHNQITISDMMTKCLPKMACFRAHTPVYGPWPEKCREDYLFKYRNLLLCKLRKLIHQRESIEQMEGY